MFESHRSIRTSDKQLGCFGGTLSVSGKGLAVSGRRIPSHQERARIATCSRSSRPASYGGHDADDVCGADGDPSSPYLSSASWWSYSCFAQKPSHRSKTQMWTPKLPTTSSWFCTSIRKVGKANCFYAKSRIESMTICPRRANPRKLLSLANRVAVNLNRVVNVGSVSAGHYCGHRHTATAATRKNQSVACA